MNPTRSAKTTETSRRSPPSLTGSAAGATLGDEGAGVGAPAVSAVPQLKQNRFEGSLAVPHDEHSLASACPQLEQNACPSGFSDPQFPQLIICTPRRFSAPDYSMADPPAAHPRPEAGLPTWDRHCLSERDSLAGLGQYPCSPTSVGGFVVMMVRDGNEETKRPSDFVHDRVRARTDRLTDAIVTLSNERDAP